MFDKILDLVVLCWERICPAEIIHVYMGAAVLRLGKYHRTVGPGLHWKIPVVEEMIPVETCLTTLRLPPQTLTTRDGVGVVVAAIIKYEIKDIEKYVTKIWDQHDVLADVTMGSIRHSIAALTYDEIVASPPEESVLKRARGQVNEFGFKLHAITFTDLGKIRSIRLIQRTPGKINN